MRLYTPAELDNLMDIKDDRSIRREYTRMRKEALRRLAILEREGVINYIDNVPEITSSRGQSIDYIFSELKDLNLLLKNNFTKISFVKKFEKDIIKTLHESGYMNIDSSNIRDFNRFMGKIKGVVDDKVLGSDRLAEVFDQAARLNMDISILDNEENIEYMREHMSAIFEQVPQKNGKEMSLFELERRIKIYERYGKVVGKNPE